MQHPTGQSHVPVQMLGSSAGTECEVSIPSCSLDEKWSYNLRCMGIAHIDRIFKESGLGKKALTGIFFLRDLLFRVRLAPPHLTFNSPETWT